MQPNEVNDFFKALFSVDRNAKQCDELKTEAISKLSAEQKKKLDELIGDKDKLAAFLNSPQAKAIINKIENKGG